MTTTASSRKVRKRDNTTLQDFDDDKIAAAIRGAMSDINEVDEDRLRVVTKTVVGAVADLPVVGVEEIQDAVEVALMRHKMWSVAKQFILYRNKRTEARSARRHPDPNAVADYITVGKYARYLPEQLRRETYFETVARDEEMHLRRFPQLETELRWAFDRVREKRTLPSMRSMQFGGKAIEQNNNRIYNCSFTLMDRPRAFAETLYLLLCGCGVGYSVQFEHVEKLPALKRVDKDKVVHHTIADTIEGWADALDALINSYIEGYYVEFNFSLIRAKGSPLKTSGGKAPGHRQLKESLEQIRKVLHGAQGRQLRPIEVHDIQCFSADAVLSGGIRRSAMICLFSLEDGEMMQAKTGDWFDTAPWRQNANNSVMLKRDEVKKKAFKRIFKSTKEYGEPGFYFCFDFNYGSNPCQPGNAPVMTPEGIRSFDDISIGSTIWSGKRWTKVTNKVMTGVKPVFAYHTTAGRFLGTEQHRIVSDGEKVEVQYAETIDTAQGPTPEASALDLQDVMDGMVMGDGSVHAASNDLVYILVGKDDEDYYADPVGTLLTEKRPGLSPFAWECHTTVKASELPLTYDRQVPDRFYQGSSTKVRGFLRGLYTANGSVVGGQRVTLKASSFKVVCRVQEMLSSLGIRSYYTTNQAHDVEFENGTYLCRESYDLNITSDRTKFRDLIGFVQKDKLQRLDVACATGKGRGKKSFEVVRREALGDQRVWDITVEDAEHVYWTGGLLVSNCVEIGLNPILTINSDVMDLFKTRASQGKFVPTDIKKGQTFTGWAFCNLCELNASMFKSLEDFMMSARAAAIIGTCQAAYTKMDYLGWVSECIAEREALLGIGMTGMMDAPNIALNPEYQRQVAQMVTDLNAELAAKIGIRPASRITCIKPSGTTSKALGCVANGHHAHHAKRYINRIIAKDNEAQFQYFKSINPHMCEKKPNGDWVIMFPIEAPEGALVKDDFTALEFLKMVKSTQVNWVLPGTARADRSPGLTHNVSNTCVVKSDEWEDVMEYIWENKEFFTGISLLAATGDKDFAFAPQEACVTEADEARWNMLIANYRPVDYTQMVEYEDGTDLAGVPACSGDKCENPNLQGANS